MAIAFAKAGVANIGVGARSSFHGIEGEIEAAAKTAGHPPPAVLTVQMDVVDVESVKSAAAEFEKRFDHVDILVNNAGIVEEPFRLIGESDPDVWWTTLTVNLRGPYLVARSFLPLLLRSNIKTIVNIGSVAQNYITPGASAYGLSKLALPRLSEYLNAEYEAQKILSYTIHPGAILTNLGHSLPDYMSPLLTDKEPLPANTVVYLTQQRQEWLAGRYISATWDMLELFDKKDEIVRDDLLKIRMLV